MPNNPHSPYRTQAQLAKMPPPGTTPTTHPWWVYALVIAALIIGLPLWLAILACWWTVVATMKLFGISAAAATVPLWGTFHPASRRTPWGYGS